MTTDLTLYTDLLGDIKARIRQAQVMGLIRVEGLIGVVSQLHTN